MSNWQSIETAPKDGTTVILSGIYSVATGAAVHPRNEYNRVDSGYWSGGRWQTGSFHIWEKATHWMPLPEPPKDE